MKRFFYPIAVWLALFLHFEGVGQDKDEKENWFERNQISIRKSFDGSKNENRPAALGLLINHKSDNDFINVDIAVKIKEWELFPESSTILTLFPVVEWHKSSNEDDEKNKLNFRLNTETFLAPNWTLKPYLLSNITYKRNLMEGVNELKYVAQMSLSGAGSSNELLPGVSWRFKDEESNYKGLYYPYIGYEYNQIPELVNAGDTAFFSTWFIRLFVEFWALPQTIQFNIDGTYRSVFGEEEGIDNSLPILRVSLNFYPGKQDQFSIGLDHKTGHDPDTKFQQLSITSLNLKYKI